MKGNIKGNNGNGRAYWLSTPLSKILAFCALAYVGVSVVNVVAYVFFTPDETSSTQQTPHFLRRADIIAENSIDSSNNVNINNNKNEQSIADLRKKLPPSVWTVAGGNAAYANPQVVEFVLQQLEAAERAKAIELCGKFLYSSLQRAVEVGDMGEQAFVATGDIDDMWTRDSAVQMGIYMGRMTASSSSTPATAGQPWLRLLVEGAIRRQAFNIIQDPYGNAYERKWVDPSKLPLRDRVIGRGGWVATRNYELDSAAYFFTQIYDFYVAQGDLYRPEVLLQEPLIYEAVLLLVETLIVEQNHDSQSPYRYFELPNGGKGSKTAYTGMSWAGFRPSDDPCKYGFLVPANIHAAAGLERILVLNQRVWHSTILETKATKLLHDIEGGIRKYGVVDVGESAGGTQMYAYEVDGLGGVLKDFDDANVPSLLSVPLLGWSGYDKEVYKATRERLLSPKTNRFYKNGEAFRGMGSPHTPEGFVWPMSFTMEALTEKTALTAVGSGASPSSLDQQVADAFVFQIRQSLKSACNDAMHEGVSSSSGCKDNSGYTRHWFEWANALFVVLVETGMGQRCDASGKLNALHQQMTSGDDESQGGKDARKFYSNPYNNDPKQKGFYQGVEAQVKHHE